MAYEQVIDVARSAGGIIMKHYRQNVSVTSKSKTSYDPVTIADLEADEYIRKRLGELFPSACILTEEHIVDKIDYDHDVWIVDPLDGTKEFVRNGTDFSVMIALLREGALAFGVVYAPVNNVLYYAEAGKGAYKTENGKTTRINVSDVEAISNATQIVRASYTNRNMLDEFVKSVGARESIEKSSIGLRLCAVAEGKADLYINTIIVNKWDTAAGEIILEEAGGVLQDFDGKKLDYKKDDVHWTRSFVASNMPLQSEAMKAIPKNAFELMYEKLDRTRSKA